MEMSNANDGGPAQRLPPWYSASGERACGKIARQTDWLGHGAHRERRAAKRGGASPPGHAPSRSATRSSARPPQPLTQPDLTICARDAEQLRRVVARLF